MHQKRNLALLIGMVSCAALSACSGGTENSNPGELVILDDTQIVDTIDIPQLVDATDNPVVVGSAELPASDDATSIPVLVDMTELPPSNDTASVPLCLSHLNGVNYCVDHTSRLFSAMGRDGLGLWSFVLPGDNDQNAIVEVLAVDDGVAIIADKESDSVEDEHTFENKRYEVSLFSVGGAFIDTRHLLQIPDKNVFVAICSNESVDDCTSSLATHQFTNNGSWEYHYQQFLGNVISTDIINTGNYELLLDNLSDFWGTKHFKYGGQALSEFYEAVGDQLVVSHDITDSDIPADWLENFASRVDLYELELCPGGGSIIRFPHNPSMTLYQDCKYLDWTVSGEYSSKSAHRTSDLHYDNLTITRNDASFSMTGGYSFTFGGLFGSNSFSTEYFLNATNERSTEVKQHSYSSSYSSSIEGGGMDGWPVVLEDGRRGQYVDKGRAGSWSSVTCRLTDSAFANTPISVSAMRGWSVTGRTILLSDGSYVPPNEPIVFERTNPGNQVSAHTETFVDYYPKPYYTGGRMSFAAEDGSSLVVSPYTTQYSPLAEVSLYTGGNESPLFTTYMDFRP